MNVINDFLWFQNNIVSKLKSYEIEYHSYSKGDFGALNQIEFNSQIKGGNIDFWETGWFGIFMWDYDKDMELMNVLLEPSEEGKIKDAIFQLIEILND